MKRTPLFGLFLIAALLAIGVPQTVASTVVVGTCMNNDQTYPTISQAVSSVPSGSTVLVCPGVYAEQVTVTQPLTLRGVTSGNTANPTIIVPAGGLTESVTAPTNGVTMYFQILVQGTESGLVNISNIAVNGSSSANQGINGWIEGIYYQNSSGTVSNVATYGQNGNGYGFGIFVEGTTTPAKTVTVRNNSVHDFDAEGIRTNGHPWSPTLTVNIASNSVIHSNTFTGNPAYGGIDVQGATGTISNNRVITQPSAPGISAGVGIGLGSSIAVTVSTVENFSVGIWVGNCNSMKGNQVSLAGAAIVISGNGHDVENNSLRPQYIVVVGPG